MQIDVRLKNLRVACFTGFFFFSSKFFS